MSVVLVILFVCMTVTKSTTGTLMNQHVCSYEKNTLSCRCVGDDLYRTDRTLKEVQTLKFDKFGFGSIFVSSEHLPNLNMIIIDSLIMQVKQEEICKSVHASDDMTLRVENKMCENQQLTTSKPATAMNIEKEEYRKISMSVTVQTEKRNFQTEIPAMTNSKMQTLIIVRNRLRRWIDARYQEKVIRSKFSGLSYSERIRARRANQSFHQKADSEV